MVVWTIVILGLAFVGLIVNYVWGTPLKLSLHDIVIFLVALGILVRIRYKTKEGEKEKLQQTIDELTTKKNRKKKKKSI
jgi:hypothetical protein